MTEAEQELAQERRASLMPDEAAAAARVQASLFGGSAPSPLDIPRYRIDGLLGSGGMGVVYAGHDEDLERKVAIKVLRGMNADVDTRRLRREAQALAQVSDPHIVRIYDIGVHTDARGDAGIHVVLEFVEGRTLNRWVRDEAPRWSRTLEVLLGAGRGLAAAHRAGVVHRDFKPNNVMVDDGGMARILDFGLSVPAQSSVVASTVDDSFPLDPRFTQTGTVLGTPPYMPPEQHRGGSADVRSDQYSYCVTVYEALWGRRPFTGTSLRELLVAKQRSLPDWPPDGRIPRRLYAALVRGMAPDPDERFDTIEDLLAALERSAKGSRWAVPSMLGGGALVAAAVVASIPGESRVDPCEDGPAGLEGRMLDAWSAADRDQLGKALASDEPGRGAATQRVQENFDNYADSWRREFGQWCESPADDPLVRDQSLGCFRSRARDVSDLVQALLDSESDALQSAVSASASLPSPAQCRSLDRTGIPDEVGAPQVRDRIEGALSQARASVSAGQPEAALRRLDELEADLGAVASPSVQARALLVRSGAERDLGRPADAARSLEAGYYRALEARDDTTAIRCATELMYVVGYRLSRTNEALDWARHAASKLERAHVPDIDRAEFLRTRGIVQLLAGDNERAKADLEAVLSLLRDAEDPAARMTTAAAIEAMITVSKAEGDYERALEQAEQCHDLKVELLGTEHQEVAAALFNRGAARADLGDSEGAIADLKAALDLRRRVLPEDHPDTVFSLNGFGLMLIQMGRYEEARQAHAEALERVDRDAMPAEAGRALSGLGTCALRLGDAEKAAEYHREAITVLTGAEQGTRMLSAGYGNLAIALIQQGKTEEAVDHFEQARDLIVQHFSPSHPEVAMYDAQLARALIVLGDLNRAQRELDRGLARAEGSAMRGNRRALQLTAVELHLARGETDAAKGLAQAVLESARADGDIRMEQQAHNALQRAESDPA